MKREKTATCLVLIRKHIANDLYCGYWIYRTLIILIVVPNSSLDYRFLIDFFCEKECARLVFVIWKIAWWVHLLAKVFIAKQTYDGTCKNVNTFHIAWWNTTIKKRNRDTMSNIIAKWVDILIRNTVKTRASIHYRELYYLAVYI